jgi:SAM-dependent methyltransferase
LTFAAPSDFLLFFSSFERQAFGPSRLDIGNASVVFDLGMGTGKILIQAFLQFRNLRYIFGIELSSGRYKYVFFLLRYIMGLPGSEEALLAASSYYKGPSSLVSIALSEMVCIFVLVVLSVGQFDAESSWCSLCVG